MCTVKLSNLNYTTDNLHVHKQHRESSLPLYSFYFLLNLSALSMSLLILIVILAAKRWT